MTNVDSRTHRLAVALVILAVALVVVGVALRPRLASVDVYSATSDGIVASGRASSTVTTRASSTSVPTPTSSSTSTTSTTSPATRPGWTGSGEPVTLAFGGDIHFERFLGARLSAETETMLDPVLAMLGDADVAVANLETAVTERGQAAPKQYVFRTDERAFDALRAGGVDVVSLANNHGLDFGVVGLEDTIDAAAGKDFPIIGIGRDEDHAYRPWTTTVRGQRIAVIGATQVLDDSMISSWTATEDQPGLASAKRVDRLVQAVEEIRPDADTVVLFLHWGVEGTTCPVERQQVLSDQLIAAGADIVVGGHAHRIQGGGMKDGAVVHYGLGNFVFYKTSGASLASGVLEVTITGRRVDDYRWIPARLSNGVATALTGDAGERASRQWDDLRDCTDLAP